MQDSGPNWLHLFSGGQSAQSAVWWQSRGEDDRYCAEPSTRCVPIIDSSQLSPLYGAIQGAPCPASCHSIIVTPLLVLCWHRTQDRVPAKIISLLAVYIRLEVSWKTPVMLRGGMIQQRTNRVIVMEITPSCHKGGLLTPCNVGGSGTYWQMKFYPAQRVGTAPLPSRYNWLEKCCVIFSYRFIEPSRLREHFSPFCAVQRNSIHVSSHDMKIENNESINHIDSPINYFQFLEG